MRMEMRVGMRQDTHMGTRDRSYVLALNAIIREGCARHSYCTLHDLEQMWSERADSHMNWNARSAAVDVAHWCTDGGPLEWANAILHAALSLAVTKQ